MRAADRSSFSWVDLAIAALTRINRSRSNGCRVTLFLRKGRVGGLFVARSSSMHQISDDWDGFVIPRLGVRSERIKDSLIYELIIGYLR